MARCILEIKEVKRAETGEVQLTGARYRQTYPSGKHCNYRRISQQISRWIGTGRYGPANRICHHAQWLNRWLRSDAIFNKETDIVTMSGAVVVTQPDKDLRLDTEELNDLNAVKCIVMFQFSFRTLTGVSMPITWKYMTMDHASSSVDQQKWSLKTVMASRHIKRQN